MADTPSDDETPPPPPPPRAEQQSTPPPPPPDGLAPPPGYVSYGAAPTPLTPIKRIGSLSKAIAILTAIAGVVAAIGGLLTPAAVQSAEDFLAGEKSEDDFIASFGPLAVTQIVWFGAVIAAMVVTMVWMYRMSSNARAYGRRTFWAPLWAIFGWFLPPVLFVIPLLMLRELWKASSPEHVDDTDTWKRQGENPTLWAWWLFFGLLPTVLTVIQPDALLGGGFGGDTESIAEGIEDTATVAVISGLAQLVAAILWILFVRQLTRRHTSLTGES